jgi:hypothetical protein
MMPGWKTVLMTGTLLLIVNLSPLMAGMAAPLPAEPSKILRLNESPQLRLQAISFFLAVLFVCAAVTMLLWNYLRRDFAWLPRLTFAKALAGVLLWGLLFVMVLSMIAGARELMTPGAWKRQGVTYKLSGESDKTSQSVRRAHLERLRTALWHYAAKHNGKFPSRTDDSISSDLWEIPDTGGMEFFYRSGSSVDQLTSLLVYEPELDADERLALLSSGEIVSLPTTEINRRLSQGEKP